MYLFRLLFMLAKKESISELDFNLSPCMVGVSMEALQTATERQSDLVSSSIN